MFNEMSFDQVLLAGDTHGEASYMAQILDTAADAEIEAVVVLGDFGYHDSNSAMVRAARDGIATHGVSVLFLDGNHENHHLLQRESAVSGVDLTLERRPVWFGGGLFYLPRGSQVNVGGLSISAMGGAASIDKERHVREGDWFSEELLSDVDISFARASDVLLSHDAPSGWDVPGLGERWGMGREWIAELPRCEEHRERLREAYEMVRPHLVVHGHYHSQYRTTREEPWGIVEVAGLNACGWKGWGAVLRDAGGKPDLDVLSS